MTLPGFEPPPVSVPSGKLSRGQQITLRKKQSLAGGRNPGTGLPLLKDNDWKKCGNCLFAYRRGDTRNSFIKCVRSHPDKPWLAKRSEESDIRASWPACEGWAHE